MLNAVLKHCKELLFACGRKIRNAGNIGKHSHRRNSDMCCIAHSINGCREKNCCNGISVKADILSHLIVDSLCKCRVGNKYRLSAVLCYSRAHCNSLFFGNSYIDIVLAHLISYILSKSNGTRNCCRNADNLVIISNLIKHVFSKNRLIRLKVSKAYALTCLSVKRNSIVPLFLVLLGRSIALSLLRVNMDNYGMIDIFYFLKCLDKCLDVIALFDIFIIKSHCLKKINFTCTAAHS